MVTNNEAVDNFLNGKRNLAAYQFSQLIKDSSSSAASLSSISLNEVADSSGQHKSAPQPNSDEIAFNYAMINLFTGCPQRASIIFNDLVKRYPRNPRLWLRLAESMLAAERAKMTDYEHIQQLADQTSRDHLVKAKNKPILIKINPNYCQQQIQQQLQLQRGTPSNFLVTIKGYLQKSLDLINEYNDISLLTDDIPNPPPQQQSQQQQANASAMSLASGGQASAIKSSLPADSSSSATRMETQSPQLSQQLSYANPYQSISRSDLYHLRNKVQLNLAYTCLCMGEPNKALNYTTQCLKSSPLGYEKVLANLYHAEACILASRIDEAIQFLDLEILSMANSLAREHPVMTNNTKGVVYGEDMQRQIETGALVTVLTYNRSVAHAAKGDLATAHQLLRSFQPNRPNPMQVIICLLYIQLQQGQLESAKRTILNNLPQFR